MLESIPLGEVRFEPASLVDQSGRVFRWRNRLFRALRGSQAEFLGSLCANRRIRQLFIHGLVSTEVTPFSLEGYELVLEHAEVPYLSYPVEWAPEMLRDAALLICNLAEELLEADVTLSDAHPWNVLFDGARPIFVDWGSLRSVGDVPVWPLGEFLEAFIFPLYLMAAGRSRLARPRLLAGSEGPSRGDVVRLLLGRAPLAALLGALRTKQLQSRCGPAKRSLFQRLRHDLEAMEPVGAATQWTSYEGPDVKFSFDDPAGWPEKLQSVDRVLQQLQPTSVIDIGCNRGWFSQMAARRGAHVTALDTDEPSVNHLYLRARDLGLPILSLVMDVCAPTPAHGLGGSYRSATQRLSADLAFALALTHHLALRKGLSFETIVDLLAAFAKRWLLVEFVPPEDAFALGIGGMIPPWYTESFFQAALETRFRIEARLPSNPAPRVLYLCERLPQPSA